MKILEDYKKIAHELLFEVDDEKMIKYKDKDGESKEMKAGSAKTMPADHPAKQAWDKMQDAGDDSGAEKEKGQKIGGSDFDRDGGDDYKPKYVGGLRSAEDIERMEKEYDVRIPKGTMMSTQPKLATDIADAIAKKMDISREYAMSRAQELTDTDKFYVDFADELETEFQEMVDMGGHQKYDEPMYDTQGMEKMKYGGDDKDDDKYADLDKYDAKRAKEADEAIAKHGEGLLPSGTDFNTKLEDLDEDDLEEFYDEMAYDISKKYDVTPAAAADDKMYNLEDIADSGGTIGDMYNATVSSTQEYASEEGTLKFDENKKPKKKPFLKEQLERFGGGHK